MKNIKIKSTIYLLITIFCIWGIALPLYAPIDTETLYEQGMEAMKSGNYGSSELLFRKIIDSDEDDELKDRAWFNLCRSVYYQKKYKSAIYEFRIFLNDCKSRSLCTESRYWIAESHFNLKENSQAIEEYKRYISQVKDGSLVSFARDRIGSIYYTQRRYDEAIIEWEKAVGKSEDKSKNARRIFKIGDALFRNEKYAEALKRLSPLLTSKADPGVVAMSRLITGRIYQIQGNHKEALLILNGIPGNLLKEHPIYEAEYFKAVSFLATGDMNSALSFLDLFILIAQKSEWYYDALHDMGKIYVLNEKLGKVDKGIELLETVRKATKKKDLRVRVSILLSKIYYKRDTAKAIPYLEASLAVEDMEKQKEVILLLGRSYIKVRKFQKAEKVLNIFMKKYPYDKDIDQVNFLRARVLLEQGETEEAIELFEQIENENPFSVYITESNYYRAFVNYKKKNYKKAITLLNGYLKQKKIENRYGANALLFYAYLEQNNEKKAGAAINYLVVNYKNEKGIDKLLYKYAIALYKKGGPAGSYFNILVTSFPKSEWTMQYYFMVANEMYKNKRFFEAEQYYAAFLAGAAKENRGLAFYNRLLCLYNLKRFGEVISIIKEGNMPPMEEAQWRDIPLLLGRCFYRLGKIETTYQVLYKESLSEYPLPDILIFIKSAIHVGDIHSAKETVKYLEKNKNIYAESLYDMGLFYFNKEKVDDAMGFFSRIIIECPSSGFVGAAKAELSRIYIKQERYKDALARLLEIKDKNLADRKISMLINVYFTMGDSKKAIAMTRKHLKALLKGKYGEDIVKRNIEYFYKKKNLKEFNRFVRYLGRYKGNAAYINYMTGQFYYEKKYYQKSYYYFYKLSLLESEYKEESLYSLGSIALFVHRNKRLAVKYFTKLAEQDNKTSLYRWRAALNLAIIMNEMNNKNLSRYYLLEVMNSSLRGNYRAQALNLFERYGYKKEVTTGSR
ncbi:MAG: tetratricopeptide repeat protein [bacterium]|nr:tetratricopeptide repeat protein [bacterium]